MNEPIISFDTLSIDTNWQGPEPTMQTGGTSSQENQSKETLPVIARIPRVETKSAPIPQGTPVDFESIEEEIPVRTIRIDSAANAPKPELEDASAPASFSVMEAEESYSGWLLDMESILALNSRWIVMLALMAALGLTLLLLRGGGTQVEVPQDIIPSTASEETAPTIVDTNVDTNTMVEKIEATTTEIPSFPSEPIEQVYAAGPAAVPPHVAPRAELVGAIETPKTPVESSTLQTAQQPSSDGYPRTANSESQWLGPNSESKLR